ncbi:Hypothetical predicted protein [Mytilus galloprovincialis]|uniref:Uncharacterized protein n=1 Tax=Mytilus galloprovincialis TaxID=29158 RepID=A0A8B6BH60_MYTGA|nr:Hypothetical predicted protein [Mytilus galloprovincialis]
MTERSRSRHNERSSRIKTSRNQHSPEGSGDMVCIEEVDYSSEYDVQHRPTRNVSCQTRTKFVIQSKPKQKKHSRKEYHIGYVTKEESVDFPRQEDCSQKYVIQRPSTRNKQIKLVHHSETHSPKTETPLSGNIGVTIYYDKDFESLYPKSHNQSQLTDTLEQKPIEVFGLHLSQLKKDGYIYDKVRDAKKRSMENPIVMVQEDGHIYDKVTDDIELITINISMERHEPAERFCHDRQQSKYSHLSKKQKKNVINQTIVYDYR